MLHTQHKQHVKNDLTDWGLVRLKQDHHLPELPYLGRAAALFSKAQFEFFGATLKRFEIKCAAS